MKELMNIIVSDYRKEKFTKRDWINGALFFVALFGAMLLAGWLETH